MTATRIERLNDGTRVLEAFDFRSEFAFEEFCRWIANALNVSLQPARTASWPEARISEWRGEIFRLTRADEFGCHVRATGRESSCLETMQKVLMSSD
ncbi:MAG TPA: hypothetical protein VF727_03000 [Allosphingosinicella sp.]